MSRGNVSLSLRVVAEDQAGTLTVNQAQMQAVLDAMAQIEAQAMAQGLSLAPANAGDILSQRGVLESNAAEQDTTGLSAALMQDFEAVLESFLEMRATEGAALAAMLSAHLDDIARLTDEAAKAAEARKPEVAENLRRALMLVMENADGVEAPRVAQELAMLAVKADVTEEISRLGAHVDAARDLLAQGSPIGRKFDFLTQEFNREANTLCSKSQSAALTGLGLELKAIIDQMREQVQNVE
jgi:uncharacterized protein (TIGR00255 family)